MKKLDQKGFAGIILLVIVLVVAGIGFVAWKVFLGEQTKPEKTTVTSQETKPTAPATDMETKQNYTEVKSASFLKSMPGNNENWTAGSANSVSMTFSKPTNPDKSRVEVTKNGISVLKKTEVISPVYDHETQSLSAEKMYVETDGSQKGNYIVKYMVCFTDGACEEGSFGYSMGM